MRIVAALGGNALLERGEAPEALIQRGHVRRAAQALAPLAAAHHLIVCHGNGPQVGMLAMESESDPQLSHPYPLDALGAQTQGLIGYWLQQELRNAGVAQPIATVVTQTVVSAADPGFGRPTKFVGPVYSKHRAQVLARDRGWNIAEDGDKWRRVVASPEPQRFVEMPAIRSLVDSGVVTICAGGAGAPVIVDDDERLVGVDAVVAKDLAAALLARELHADALLLLTDVPAVMRDFGSDHATAIDRIDVAELQDLTFPAGSMGPKVEACRRFVEAGTGRAAIGALADAAALLDGTAGTTVVASPLDPRTGRYVESRASR
ncbi:MAG: carbamate kinase [Actinobacteria bacterium]|nr:carbamate kinase [Actinomycetota bacterium]